jgi:hypothetical protein
MQDFLFITAPSLPVEVCRIFEDPINFWQNNEHSQFKTPPQNDGDE